MTHRFSHHERGRMSPQRIAKIFLARDGRCHKCGRALRPGDDYDIDHIIALENGGTDEDSNLAPCCDWCHSEKTAEDHATAGHGRRMAARHVVPGRFRKSKSWR